ncbi:transcriptional activator NhaR [Herbaspirillum sp. AP02]|uniref:transcriptional activator NhaR n=1 Tax=unclassified Herbaspirillum TaxID=2624150 RepID=UPI0015D9D803|nr:MULTISPECIES: transcriptional activator NhaR [unclassified Herbaspirillum]MBG7622460.1 transcriptional activator NhaR [Herbaspirillum sp. AP02]NZD70170.1 transcriptional activator NhaR [Herbaspirillum sp. AP21]
MASLNYKHLHYFWTVAKSGGVARAGERLHLTAQTISGQISLFEESLGYKLFRRVGRRLELNDEGRMVFDYAERIFSLGEELEEALRLRPGGRALQLRVGVADAVPKAIAYLLLESALAMPDPIRIICREGKLDVLLAELAIHKLDIIIADSPMPPNVDVRGYHHLLGECDTSFFATPELARRYRKDFPRSFDGAPFLMPGEDAAVRPRLLRWFEKEQIRPQITGEFDDGALLLAFGDAGTGIFAAPSAIATQIRKQYGLVEIGRTDAIREQFYAISVERRLTHPAVLAIQSAARGNLLVGSSPAQPAARTTSPPSPGGRQS